MNGLDFGVQNRVNGINTGYVTRPQEFQPKAEPIQTAERKRTFDREYCQTVQAYFAPNFLKAGEKPCSVTEYNAKLLAAGLQEGKDFDLKGRDDGENFGLDIILKDSAGRIKKCTSWENGLESENFMGYDKYSYSELDPSYKKISSYSGDNKLFYIAETTKAIPQKDFTSDGLSFNTRPKDFIAELKSKGANFKVTKDFLGNGDRDFCITVKEQLPENGESLTQWFVQNGKLVSVCRDSLNESGNIQKRIAFYQDDSTEITRYFN